MSTERPGSTSLSSLSSDEMERYQAHLSLPGFGPAGQARLRRASVLLVGVGGLGCPAAQYLVAAGIGALTLVDDDIIETTNLQRQVLFGDDDLGRLKVDVAAERLSAINGAVRIESRRERLVGSNARAQVAGHDLVIDGCDNFATRYVVNDACALEALPLVSGSIYRYEGQVALFESPHTPCYRCVFPESPEAETPCHDAGVLGALAGLVGSAMAGEAVQWLANGASALAGRMLLVDTASMRFRNVRLQRAADCALCGASPSIHEPTAVATCAVAR